MKKFSIESKKYILLGLFVSALVTANLIGSKISVVWGVTFSVGIFAYPITFLITDLIEEVFGKKHSRRFLLAGAISMLVVFAWVALALVLPPADRFQFESEYQTIFKVSLRFIVASLIAFVLSQLHDIWAFGFWRKKTKGRFLWLRNNASTIVSQFVDTVIFMFIALYKVAPQYDAAFIFKLIIPYWLLKVLFALLDTPLVYLGVRWLRKSQQDESKITAKVEN